MDIKSKGEFRNCRKMELEMNGRLCIKVDTIAREAVDDDDNKNSHWKGDNLQLI